MRIDSFTDQMEGIYSCIARTDSGASAEQVFEYDLIESCPAGKHLNPFKHNLPSLSYSTDSYTIKSPGRSVGLALAY